MTIEIIETAADTAGVLEQYGTISIAFTVTSRLAIYAIGNGLGGLRLVEEPLATPYRKDYDARHDEGPARWRSRFDVSRWGVLTAFDGDSPMGGAVLVWNTPGVDMLEGRSDLAVLWDLRVHPDYRGRGVGHRLFAASEEWARARGCPEIKIETQNINVAACRFYARQGCELRTIHQNAYPDLPEEAQLLWHKRL